jgi:uncharacterized zinc-type alcohol dehydrogenase-like protein
VKTLPVKSKGYVAQSPSKKLELFNYELPDIAADHVRIKVTHCGLCHSDLHIMENDLGNAKYPLVPGHEVVGIIEEVGADVKGFKYGQRVGIGWSSNSCGHCKQCDHQRENLCPQGEALIVNSMGGFADKVDVKAHFAYAIPEKLASENAAPLLCAGITVFAPLKRYIKEEGMTVAIVGIGGLGHLGLQFAKAMGATVVAISHSENKKDEAISFGADKFVNSQNEAEMAALEETVDLILDTVSAPHSVVHYFNALAPNGVLCMLGLTLEKIDLMAIQFIPGQKSITGSAVGSPKDIDDMLKFAAKHDIVTQTEVMPMANVNEAIEKLERNEARYRIVLEA